jgi:DNA uptake protein ComE-like DNA-binding protein
MSIVLSASLRRASVTLLGAFFALAMLAGPAAMAKGDKGKREKAEGGERAEKAERGDRGEKAEKAERGEKAEKAEKDKESRKEKVPTVVIADEEALLVVLNKADAKTLTVLPGIGKKTAERVIEGRPYKEIDELKKVKGIAEKRLARIKSSVGKTKVPESVFADDEE